MVLDTLEQHPRLIESAKVFITGVTEDVARNGVEKVRDSGVAVQTRRFEQDDFELPHASKYYICTGTPLRKQLMDWLSGKEVIFEDFNF